MRFNFCPDCGSEVKENQRFCANCGANLSQLKTEESILQKKFHVCPFCGKSEALMNEYCSNCGAELLVSAEEKWYRDVSTGTVHVRKGESVFSIIGWIFGTLVFYGVLFAILAYLLPLELFELIIAVIVIGTVLFLIYAFFYDRWQSKKRQEKRKRRETSIVEQNGA